MEPSSPNGGGGFQELMTATPTYLEALGCTLTLPVLSRYHGVEQRGTQAPETRAGPSEGEVGSGSTGSRAGAVRLALVSGYGSGGSRDKISVFQRARRATFHCLTSARWVPFALNALSTPVPSLPGELLCIVIPDPAWGSSSGNHCSFKRGVSQTLRAPRTFFYQSICLWSKFHS